MPKGSIYFWPITVFHDFAVVSMPLSWQTIHTLQIVSTSLKPITIKQLTNSNLFTNKRSQQLIYYKYNKKAWQQKNLAALPRKKMRPPFLFLTHFGKFLIFWGYYYYYYYYYFLGLVSQKKKTLLFDIFYFITWININVGLYCSQASLTQSFANFNGYYPNINLIKHKF